MDIRFATGADFDAMHALMLDVHRPHVEHLPHIYRDGDPLPRGEFDELIRGDGAYALLAEREGRVTGMCVVRLRDIQQSAVSLPRRVAHMDVICVDEHCRHAGVGAALYARARDEATARGCQSLELMVWAFNSGALEFYRAMGMEVRSYVMQDRLDGEK